MEIRQGRGKMWNREWNIGFLQSISRLIKLDRIQSLNWSEIYPIHTFQFECHCPKKSARAVPMLNTIELMHHKSEGRKKTIWLSRRWYEGEGRWRSAVWSGCDREDEENALTAPSSRWWQDLAPAWWFYFYLCLSFDFQFKALYNLFLLSLSHFFHVLTIISLHLLIIISLILLCYCFLAYDFSY